MTPEIGLFLLIAALAVSLLQLGSGVLLRNTESTTAERFSSHLSTLFFFCITAAFLLLINGYVESDFSLKNVVENSHTDKPLIYKISGAWGNHEGSMLLWVWVLALYGFLYAVFSPPHTHWVKRSVLTIHSLLGAGFLLFIIFTSNPFARMYPSPIQGNDLNPLLQDIGLALHPPLLYMGYVGFSIVYSLAIAALVTGTMDSRWSHTLRPWVLIPWSFLTLGIGMGSWWAYRELGWGGWWFWDPVENASLLPWLSATALLHSNMVSEKRGSLRHWTLLLAILTFSLSVLGTFLVRSGIITSVHSFASDPARGLFILGYLVVLCGGGLLLLALKPPAPSPSPLRFLSREGGILLNNLFLISACLTVLLATLYPLVLQLMGERSVSIGAPYYNATFIPLVIPLLLLAGLGTFLPWKRARAKPILNRISISGGISLVAFLLVLALTETHRIYSALGIGLGVWLMLSSLQALWIKSRRFSTFRTLTGSIRGMIIAHFGLGMLVLGVTGSSLWQREINFSLKPEESINLSGFNIRKSSETTLQSDNYTAKASDLEVTGANNMTYRLLPESRYYPARNTTTSEADIQITPFYDLYAVVGESSSGKTQYKLYYTPLMLFLWIGFALMALGGMVGLSNPRKTEASKKL